MNFCPKLGHGYSMLCILHTKEQLMYKYLSPAVFPPRVNAFFSIHSMGLRSTERTPKYVEVKQQQVHICCPGGLALSLSLYSTIVKARIYKKNPK